MSVAVATRRAPRRSAQIGVLALAVLAALLAAEALARLVGIPPEFGSVVSVKGLPTRVVGGVPLWTSPDPRATEAEITRAGSTDHFLIVGLGDSVLSGVGLPREQTYFEQARARLAERAPQPVELLNLAVEGFSTAQENARHAEVSPRVKGDLVVVHYWSDDARQYRLFGNHLVDFGDMDADGRLVTQVLPLPRAANDFLLVHSRLYDLLTHVVVSRRQPGQAAQWSQVTEPLAAIHERTVRDGGRLLIIASPDLFEAEPRPNTDLPALRRFAAARGIEVLDPTPWLAGAASRDVAFDGCHLNAEGHRRFGEGFAQYLVDHHLREPGAPGAPAS